MSLYADRIEHAVELMIKHGMDAIILTKPANMFYLTGDGRLCAYAMVTLGGKVAMGLPQTDLEDIQSPLRKGGREVRRGRGLPDPPLSIQGNLLHCRTIGSVLI